MWFLIVTLFPNSGPFGSLMGHVIALLLYFILFFRLRIRVSDYLKPLMIFGIAFSASIFMSLIVNHGNSGANISLVRYGFVPLYWLFGLIAGIVDWQIFGSHRKQDFLYQIAGLFICIQLPFIFLQVLGMDSIISPLWSIEKARDWTRLVRVVGTVGNPNTLGILVVMAIIIFVNNLWRKTIWTKVFIGLSVIIIVITGSRTSLILLLFVPLLQITKAQLFSKKTLYLLSAFCLFSVLSYFLLLYLRENLPYLSQILDLLSGKEISSLEARFDMWREGGAIFRDGSLLEQLFGLGPGYFKVQDNSYYYILYNYGAASFFVFSVVVIQVFIIIKKEKNTTVKQILIVLLICGVILDALISFLFMTVVFYLIGYHSNSMRYYKMKELNYSVVE